MGKEKIVYTSARLTGILLLGATVLHSTLGTAEVMTAIKTGDVRSGMADTFVAIWIFSSVMLLLSAIWVLFLAAELRQLKRRAWWQGIFIGLGYTAGAIACMGMTAIYAHLVGFMLIGLILLGPLLAWAGHFHSVQH